MVFKGENKEWHRWFAWFPVFVGRRSLSGGAPCSSVKRGTRNVASVRCKSMTCANRQVGCYLLVD